MSRVGRHFSLITISAGLVATSVSSFGAVPSHAAPSRRSVPAHPDRPSKHQPKAHQAAHPDRRPAIRGGDALIQVLSDGQLCSNHW